MHPSLEVLGSARADFGWADNLEVSLGARGALGQIWRIDTDAASYALKEIFDEPPPTGLGPKAERPQRDWAEREIEVHLHLLPNPRQLPDVLSVMRRASHARNGRAHR